MRSLDFVLNLLFTFLIKSGGYNILKRVQILNKEELKMEFTDKTLVCKDCGNEFVFTAGEQAFYKEKGLDNEPKRCKECRDKRKAEKFSKEDNR